MVHEKKIIYQYFEVVRNKIILVFEHINSDTFINRKNILEKGNNY